MKKNNDVYDDEDDDDDGGGVPGFPADAAVCSASQTERPDQESETCKGFHFVIVHVIIVVW